MRPTAELLASSSSLLYNYIFNTPFKAFLKVIRGRINRKTRSCQNKVVSLETECCRHQRGVDCTKYAQTCVNININMSLASKKEISSLKIHQQQILKNTSSRIEAHK